MKRWITSLLERALDAIADELAPKIARCVSTSAIAEATRTLSCQILAQSTARAHAEQRASECAKLAARAQVYFEDRPAPSAEEINWSKDDQRTLAGILDTPTGKKLMQHLSNRLADYERAAVMFSNAQNAAALCKRAHGFRDCRGEIVRLSAAGPSPANHEELDFALPADLEKLRA